jgi:hypothetical protein
MWCEASCLETLKWIKNPLRVKNIIAAVIGYENRPWIKGNSEERSGDGRWCSSFLGAHKSQQQCPATMYTIKTPRSISRLLKLRDGLLCMELIYFY